MTSTASFCNPYQTYVKIINPKNSNAEHQSIWRKSQQANNFLRILFRLIRPGGLVSHVVDYYSKLSKRTMWCQQPYISMQKKTIVCSLSPGNEGSSHSITKMETKYQTEPSIWQRNDKGTSKTTTATNRYLPISEEAVLRGEVRRIHTLVTPFPRQWHFWYDG